jgi:hypothetical protein
MGIDDYYSVDVVGHDYEGVGFDFVIGNFPPIIFNDFANHG